MKTINHRACGRIATITLLLLCGVAPAFGQQQIEARVDIPFNRFYDFDQMTDAMERLAEAHPDLASLVSLGRSVQDRDLWLLAINNPETGSDTEKPAIWIDGNIHGNEVQAAETVLYTAWYLLEAYDEVPSIRTLVDDHAFYLVPMVNPDGRAGWFTEAHSPNSNRGGLKPTDSDRDGLVDEDGPEDLDGDGHIGRMWRADPNGTHRRSERDPRIFERVPRVPGPDGSIMTGDWSMAGSEGIDNDGDGRINEDGEGGYDMNRNFPSDWQPVHVQRGAGTHPFCYPETRAIGDFIRAHPNIAAGQSYHNTGGMLLRGPGVKYGENAYPRADRSVYDALGAAGVEMLPHYDYLIIHSDLYGVHGGCVNWMAEGLGIVSFTNELWTDRRIFQEGDRTPDEEGRFRWQDRMLFGQTFTDWTEYDHPTLGEVLIGGGTKYSRRTPPPFMLEEEAHRNFAFTMFHADQMPKLRSEIEAEEISPDLWQVDVVVCNDRLIPTRTARAADRGIGRPDLMLFEPGPGTELVLAGIASNRMAPRFDPVDHRPRRLVVDRGIPGQGEVVFRYVLESEGRPTGTFRYLATKARDLEVELGNP